MLSLNQTWNEITKAWPDMGQSVQEIEVIWSA